MAHDALSAHARDELGISDASIARPVQAALASAGSFALGAVIPLLSVLVMPSTNVIPIVVGTSVLLLALLGGIGAHAGRAPVMKAAFTFDTEAAIIIVFRHWGSQDRMARDSVA
jgi:VIT1/CCC1 family predicted Fe2+/Mn2+ transporter